MQGGKISPAKDKFHSTIHRNAAFKNVKSPSMKQCSDKSTIEHAQSTSKKDEIL